MSRRHHQIRFGTSATKSKSGRDFRLGRPVKLPSGKHGVARRRTRAPIRTAAIDEMLDTSSCPHDASEDLLAREEAVQTGDRPIDSKVGGGSPPRTQCGSARGVADCVVDDESATEDLILDEPPRPPAAAINSGLRTPRPAAARRGRSRESQPMPELPPRGDIAKLANRGARPAPRRIGKGALVPARLTWKPGDPFGEGRRRSGPRFRWEAMLTSACITAASGLICVWLLHSILA